MEWISVNDKLPDDYNDKLLCLQNGHIFIGNKTIFAETFILQSDERIDEENPVVYWMSLPKPPNIE